MDGRTVPDRTIEVLASLNADVIALQEVIGAGPNDSGHAEAIGAALGMGWVMASVRHLRGHQFGNVDPLALSDPAARPVRPVLAHLRAALLPARRYRHRRPDAAPLQRAPGHGVSRAERSGRSARGHRARRPHHPPKILLGDFNEWSGGYATAAADEKARGDRPQDAPETPAHVSRASCRCCTSITSITRARSTSPASRSRARGNPLSRQTICRFSRSSRWDSNNY